jgi:hypothetical protein
MPTPSPRDQFIAIARTIVRGLTEQLPAIPRVGHWLRQRERSWRDRSVEGMEWRKRPGEARSMRSVQRPLSDHGPATRHHAQATQRLDQIMRDSGGRFQ